MIKSVCKSPVLVHSYVIMAIIHQAWYSKKKLVHARTSGAANILF